MGKDFESDGNKHRIARVRAVLGNSGSWSSLEALDATDDVEMGCDDEVHTSPGFYQDPPAISRELMDRMLDTTGL